MEFHDEQAQAVAIAGTFNDWRPEATPMLGVGEGRWVKELVLPPGRYEYLLVVDGEWKCDPAAPERVPNPFGTKNSVLEVPATRPGTRGPEPAGQMSKPRAFQQTKQQADRVNTRAFRAV